MHDYMDSLLDFVDTLLYRRVAYDMLLQYFTIYALDHQNTAKNHSFAKK